MNQAFYNKLLALASLLGALGVIAGAFGAHFLKNRISLPEIEIIRTGVLYLFIHVVVTLIIILLAGGDGGSRLLRSAGIMFVTGIFLFSGSLFLISTQSLTGIHSPLIGAATPVGGFCFITGWFMLFAYAWKRRLNP
jgi:uncharacterized membrane protein YgdD (TMEM256/DUF423 family)